MTGIGLIVFGAFFALFGLVLVSCITYDRRHCTCKTIAQIIDITKLSNPDMSSDSFEVTLAYSHNDINYISKYIVSSLGKYKTGSKAEILYNPKKPTKIILGDKTEPIPFTFLIISGLGIGFIILGIMLVLQNL